MDLSITNYSGQPLVLLTSDLLYDKQFISDNMPNIQDLLSSAANQGWLSSLESGVYVDSIDRIVSTIRQSINPQILYQDFILAGDTAFLRNIFVPPKYIYCIGLTSHHHNSDDKAKLMLTFNVFNTEAAIGKYASSDDLLTAIHIYLGYDNGFTRGDGTFYCDNITPSGTKVCQKPLPVSARFINDAYESRHNPQIMINDTYMNDQLAFEQNMITQLDINSRTIMRNPTISNPIPEVGLNGSTYVAHLFLSNNSKSSFAKSSDDVKQTFTIGQTPNTWASLAVLFFVLLIVAIIVGVALFALKKGSSVNVYGSSLAGETQPSIYI